MLTARRVAPSDNALRTPWAAISGFLLPALVIYAAFTAYPVLRTFWNALHKVLPNGNEAWVGLANLHAILTRDPTFWKAVGNTMTWALVAPLIEVSIGLLLALALYARVPFARFFRVAWFTPVLISYVVVGILWVWIYNYDWGAANALLRFAGPRGLGASLARRSSHRAAGADLHHHVDVDRLQHGRAARGALVIAFGGPRGGRAGQLRLGRQARASSSSR